MTNQDNLNQAILGIASKKASTDSSQSRHLAKMGTRYSGRGSAHYQYTFPNEQNQLTVPGYVEVNPAANLISQYLAKLIKPKKKTELAKESDKADRSSDIYNSSRQIISDLEIENYKLDPIGLKPGDPGYDPNFANSVLSLRQKKIIDAAQRSKELETTNESTTENHMNNIIKNKIKNQCYKVLSEMLQGGGPTQPEQANPNPKKKRDSTATPAPAKSAPAATPVAPPAVDPTSLKKRDEPAATPAATPAKPAPTRLLLPGATPAAKSAPAATPVAPTATPAPAKPATPVVPNATSAPKKPAPAANTTPGNGSGNGSDTGNQRQKLTTATVWPDFVADRLYDATTTPAIAAGTGAATTMTTRPGSGGTRVSSISGKPSQAVGLGGVLSIGLPTALRFVDTLVNNIKEPKSAGTNIVKGVQDLVPHFMADLAGFYSGAALAGTAKRMRDRETATGRKMSYDEFIAKGGAMDKSTGKIIFPSRPETAGVASRSSPFEPVPEYSTSAGVINTSKQLAAMAAEKIGIPVGGTIGVNAIVGALGQPKDPIEGAMDSLRLTGAQTPEDRAVVGRGSNETVDVQTRDAINQFILKRFYGNLLGPSVDISQKTRTTVAGTEALTNPGSVLVPKTVNK